MKVIVKISDEVSVEFDESELTVSPEDVTTIKQLLKTDVKARLHPPEPEEPPEE